MLTIEEITNIEEMAWKHDENKALQLCADWRALQARVAELQAQLEQVQGDNVSLRRQLLQQVNVNLTQREELKNLRRYMRDVE